MDSPRSATETLPKKQHGWIVRKVGEPLDVMRVEEIDVPSPGQGQLLVEVAATGLSFGDILWIQGGYQEATPLPYIPGVEYSGTVVAAGQGTSTPVGSRVMATFPGRNLTGLESVPTGGLARYAIAEEGLAYPVGDSLSDAQAACFAIAFHNAWFAIHRRANLQPGETLVVPSGAGGVGSAAIQLGIAAGARVIAVAGGSEKVALCKALGAHVVVDHQKQDFRDVVSNDTDGRGADVVLDPVNGDVFDASRRIMASEGRLVVVGFVGQRIAEMRTNHVLLKNYGVLGLSLPYYHADHPDLVREAHQELIDLHEAGAIAPLIQREVEHSEAAQAIVDTAGRGTYGRIVVRRQQR